MLLELIGFACIVSFAWYRMMSQKLGTPLKDSLSAEQEVIRADAVSKRRGLWMKGLGIGAVLYLMWKRFKM
jgi:hypothetical protein